MFDGIKEHLARVKRKRELAKKRLKKHREEDEYKEYDPTETPTTNPDDSDVQEEEEESEIPEEFLDKTFCTPLSP